MSFIKALFASILGFFIAIGLVVGLMVMVVIGIINSATADKEVSVPTASVLKIEPEGAITEYVGNESFADMAAGSSQVTLAEYLARIETAAGDDRIKGILLQLGGYAGGWAQAGELRTKLEEFRKSGKFIYAVSGVHGWNEVNYYIASVADSVIMNPAARMEINGMYAALPFFKPALQKLGVQAEVVRAGSFKSAVEPFILDSASAESKLMMTQIVESSFGIFLSAVEASRKIPVADLRNMVETRPLLTPSEARDARLIDAVLYGDQVRDLLRDRSGKGPSDEPSIVDIEDYQADLSEGGDGRIAVVYAVGNITAGESHYSANPLFGGESVGSETFIEAMETARKDRNVKAVVIRIDSPGGDAAASDEMWRAIERTRAEKPVIASMAGTAASGGYYIAAPADTIVAEPATITGSIGVFGMWFNVGEFLREKVGINTQVIKTGQYADMYSSVRPASDLERDLAARQTDSVYQTFMSVVSKGRGLSMDSVAQIAQGRVWTGQQAQAIGLVDVLGGMERALEIAAERGGLKKGGYSIRILPRKKDFFETLSETFGSGVAALMSSRTPVDDYKAMYEALQQRSGIQARMPEVKVQ